MMKTQLLALSIAALSAFGAHAQDRHFPEKRQTSFQRAELQFKQKFKLLPLQKPMGLNKRSGTGKINKASSFRWLQNEQQWSTDTFQAQHVEWNNDNPVKIISDQWIDSSRFRMIYTDFVAVDDYYFLDYLKGFVSKTTVSQEYTDGEWQDIEKYIYTLDAQNRISKIDYFAWDNNAWVPSERYEYHYDSKGNFYESTQETYNNGQWILSSGEKFVYVYDGDKITEVVTEEFSPYSTEWEKLEKQVYTYQDNKIATAVSYDFTENEWHKYDSITNINWKNFVNGLPQHAYYYPFTVGGGSYHSYESFAYNEDDEIWEKSLQVSQTFTNNMLTENYMKMWIEDSASFVNFRRRVTDYYADGNMKEFKIYNWFMTEQNSFWSLSHGNRSNITYNNADIMQNRVDQVYRTSDNNWYNSMKFLYEYEAATSIEPMITQSFKFYPNPATETIHISLKEAGIADIRIISITGQLLKAERINNTSDFSLDVTALPKGMYFIDVMQNNQKSTQRFIKQ